MDNVSYPVFLLENGFHFFIWKLAETGIKYAVSGREHTFFMNDFSVGKARERVFSLYLSTALYIIHIATSSLYPQPLNQPTAHSHQHHTSSLAISPQYHTTA